MDSGLYMEFAKDRMKPEQIDEVDIPKLKAKYTIV
jgi:hypothetical protein